MKKILNISLISLLSIFLLVLGLLSLVFIFVECRMLFSLEWSIYHNAFNAFIRIFFRLLLALIALATVVLEVINFFKKNETMTFILFGANIGLLVLGIILFIISTNYVDIAAIIILPAVFLLKAILLFATKYYPISCNK